MITVKDCIDLLGIENCKDGVPENAYADFKERLVSRNDGTYETELKYVTLIRMY